MPLPAAVSDSYTSVSTCKCLNVSLELALTPPQSGGGPSRHLSAPETDPQHGCGARIGQSTDALIVEDRARHHEGLSTALPDRQPHASMRHS